jgi:hypothetical protein
MNMKKYIALAIMALSGMAIAQTRVEQYIIKEWVGTLGTTAATQYVGYAQTTENTTVSPSTNAAVWHITKKTYDATGLPLSESVARAADGNNHTLEWTNRVAASYNAK